MAGSGEADASDCKGRESIKKGGAHQTPELLSF